MHKCLAGLAVVMLGAALCSAGCGDNSRDCGPGTIEERGQCLPSAVCGFGTREDTETGQCIPDGSVVCTNGTVFDTLTGQCKIDPAACQNGTVLIDGACADPATGLVIDAEEGPEPNGLGIIEPSDAQAGNITLTPGQPFVVHGTIHPWSDLNNDGQLEPDVDTYVLTVTEPTFVRITADGVGGTAAGFIAVARVAGDDPLASWRRVGLSLISDTSVREVLLPAAGTYHLAIADTRTLVEYISAGFATAAPGGNTAEYYVSVAPQPIPTATALPVADNMAAVQGALASDKLAVYSVPLGTGLNAVRLAMPSELATASFVVLRDDELAAVAHETDVPARALVGDVTPEALSRIVVEQESTLLPTPAPYVLDVIVSDAPELSRTGDTVMAQATTNVGTDFSRLNLWSFDVASDDALVAMHVSFSPAIVGQIYDATGEPVAAFTPPASGATWSTYRGLVRIANAGRYYFATYAPSANSQSFLAVTSTIDEVAPEPLTIGMPLTAPIPTASRTVAFTYAPGDLPWQQFDVTGDATGGQVASWFDPAIAYGRLGSLVTSAGTLGPEVPPVFDHAFTAAGGPFGHILLSDGTPDYLVTVGATNPTASPEVTLSFAPRAASTDLGTLTSGSVTRTDETLDATTPQRFYLVRIPLGTEVTITVTPTSNVNTQFQRLGNDEAPIAALVNTSSNGADVETFTQNGADWTAFVVSATGNLPGARTYDVTVSVQ